MANNLGLRRASFCAKAIGVRTLVAGVVAQLVERLVRNEQVRGSNPLGSTNQQYQVRIHRDFLAMGEANVPELWVRTLSDPCSESRKTRSAKP